MEHMTLVLVLLRAVVYSWCEMPKNNNKPITDYVMTLNMNGLRGRMLHLPPRPRKKRELLFVYGQNGSLERWWGLLQQLNRYGGVIAADLPGLGGMRSLYKLGQKPTLDNLADYLAALVKLRCKRRRLIIVAERFGFVAVTRMLQRYPDVARKVDLVVSLGGFAHHTDFRMGRFKKLLHRFGAWWFARRLIAWWLGRLRAHPSMALWLYVRYNRPFDKKRLRVSPQIIEAQTILAHQNDMRTAMAINSAMLKLDNCQQPVKIPLWHVAMRKDQTHDHHITEQHLRVIFSEFYQDTSRADINNPMLSADVRTAAAILPERLQRVLSKLNT